MKSIFLRPFLILSCFLLCLFSHAQPLAEAKRNAALANFKGISEKIDFLNQQADAQLDEGNFEQAMFCLNKALELLKNQNLPYKAIVTYQNLGNVQSDMGNNAEALAFYNQALELAKSSANKKEMASCLNLIANVHQFQGEYARALQLYASALQINTAINEKQGIIKNHINIGNTHGFQGNMKGELNSYESALKIARELHDLNLISKCLNNLSVCFYNQGNYPEALNYLLQALKINETAGNKVLIAGNYLNIGLVYNQQKNYEEALKYQMKSLEINRELRLKAEMALNYTSLYQIYDNLNEFDLAHKFIEEALRINLESGNLDRLQDNYNNLGHLELRRGNYREALENLKRSLEINTKISKPEGISLNRTNLAKVYIKTGSLNKARSILTESHIPTLQTRNKFLIKEHYQTLVNLDSIQSDWKSAYLHHYILNLYKDSLLNESNTKKLVQSQMQYDFDKRQEADRLKQATKDALAVQEKKRQRLITIIIALALLLVVLFSVLLLNRFRLTLKQKKIIEAQKQKVEIQKTLIEEKNRQVTDSINYARKIQSAILPPLNEFRQKLPQSFILYLPKDIVAGDFYWQQQLKEEVLFAACDCTGHGVPGAMVSVVCSNALNRAIKEFHKTRPGDILDTTLQLVLENFSSSEGELKDGMDLALCSYNPRTRMLQYAGANNPLWLVRDKELIELKADKQCIGYNYQTRPFSQHELQLQTGDMVYLSSDGYADQFGGKDGKKKLTRKRFKEILSQISELSIEQQQQSLFDFFQTHRGAHDQIDDVLVLGFRA
ncbi:MAG: hypothetical protein RLZZ46_234 [Bacteroidota bacterium]